MFTLIKTYVMSPQKNRLNVDPDKTTTEHHTISIVTYLMVLIRRSGLEMELQFFFHDKLN